ncbi:GNAT family N-acetyltransferase [Methanobrevibacter sp. DSM 116169]|uniref:GNAT family N-acetyltransferase n=1 Tax=Methanobrevibacter sp. DSM 116169 TaxID=3242727 RepID=UPI0038FCFB00
MIYEDFNPKYHDTFKIAKLKYDVDFRTYEMFFNDKNKAILAIKYSLEITDPSDYFKMKIVLDDESKEILAFLSYYSKNKNTFIKDTITLFQNLKFIDALKLFLIDLLDYFVLADFTDNDIYLAELAVDSSKRGQGIGAKILNHCIESFKNKGYKKLILDVDFRNDKAKTLYEKLGFKEFNKKRLKFLNFERGMYNMEYELNE